MDGVVNPYAPGAGRPPAALVGREGERRAWTVALQRIERGSSAQHVALYGLRGVGKTVLLTSMAREAIERDWIVAQIEADSSRYIRAMLGETLYSPLSNLARPSAGKRVLRALKTALSFKASYSTEGTWSFGLDLTETAGGGADSGVLESDLDKLVQDLAAAAREEGTGFAVLIDEAQDLHPDDLTALCAVAHRATQQGWAFLLCVAGLPSLPRVVAESKSYAERLFDFFRISALEGEPAREAITVPAAAEGVTWEPEAVDFLVTRARGYPYFLQQYGQDTWNAADGPTVRLFEARIGAATGEAALDNGFFRARWDRATRGEQAYLRAMAQDGDAGSWSSEVASRMGRKPTSLGPVRANLISKGLIYAPEHGQVAFTVPAMAEFIDRQPAE